MIDFSKLTQKPQANSVLHTSFSPITVRIQDKRVLMMLQEIQHITPHRTPMLIIIESIIQHVYQQLKKNKAI